MTDPALVPLVEAVRRELAPELQELVRRAVQEALARGGGEAEWIGPKAAARLAGVACSTLRGWQKTGKLARGRRGRVNLAELRAYLAQRDGPAPSAGPLDFNRARARRIAAELRARAPAPEAP